MTREQHDCEWDTIAAIATPQGRGGVGIVRVSGPSAFNIALAILGKAPKVRDASYVKFYEHDQSIIDEGIAIFFCGPKSFTGEDVLELHGHGGPIILDWLLQRVVSLGARIAKPGEFTERAFLNNKIDLLQAEAVAMLINANSRQAAKAAQKSLQGHFSSKIKCFSDNLTQLRLYVEAAIDFPEEEIDFLSDGYVKEALHKLIKEHEEIHKIAQQGTLLSEGADVVLAGETNAGKSSLLNQITRQDMAIVTDIPGTTRDIIKSTVQIDGTLLNIIDTAGLRDSDDLVEIEGIKRTKKMLSSADLVLWIIDGEQKSRSETIKFYHNLRTLFSQKTPFLVAFNKIDIVGHGNIKDISKDVEENIIPISAKQGDGIDELKQNIKAKLGVAATNEEEVFLARRRHLEALQQAGENLLEGKRQLDFFCAGELLAEELKLSQEKISEINGEFSSDDLLGKIFSEFCIGK